MEEAAAPAGAAAASAGLAFKSCAASVGTELMPLQTSSLLMSLMSVVLLLALALLIAILAALLAIVVGFLVLLVLNWQQISRYVQITDDKRADRALDVNGTLSHVGGFVKRPPTNRISFKSEILNPVASIEKQNFGQLPNGQMPKDKYGLTVADISASSSAAVFHRKGFYFTTERNLDSDLKLYNSQGPDDISKGNCFS